MAWTLLLAGHARSVTEELDALSTKADVCHMEKRTLATCKLDMLVQEKTVPTVCKPPMGQDEAYAINRLQMFTFSCNLLMIFCPSSADVNNVHHAC